VAAPEFDVIVVGAGAAGLAAAQALRDANANLLLLEGRDRLGGRVWTNRNLPNLTLDLGASWIHGTSGNPLMDLARRFNVQTARTDYESLWRYDAGGNELSDRADESLDNRFSELMSAVRRQRDGMQDDISLQTALDQVLSGAQLSTEEQRELDYALNTEVEHEYAADSSDLSLKFWDQGEAFNGSDVLFPNGYDQLFLPLTDRLDIRMNQVVQRVAYGSNGVTITTNQATFTAQKAVLTLPLGVLQRGSVAFDPPLPAAMQTAIRRMGMGLLNKLYLRFPTAFWPEEPHLFGYIAERKGEWAEWLNLAKYGDAPVLLGFNAGSYGRRLEGLTDTQTVAAAMTVLRTMFGSSVPEPEGFLISRWAADPFAGGSYSYLRPGGSPDDYDTLATPVNNQLFFAGEATSRDYAATVHGALLSGQRAARQVQGKN
jgi:monoamine oxidase